MIINFLGDSITNGGGAEKYSDCYVSLVAKSTGSVVFNYGIGGTGFTRKKVFSGDMTDEDFLMRAEKMGDADLVFVFGGTNDYGHSSAPLGDVFSSDVYTFCGAVNRLIDYLSEKYGADKICFILPLHRYNEDDPYGEDRPIPVAPLCDYVFALKEILDKRNIVYIDLLKEIPTPIVNTGDEFTVDGLHPNNAGHKVIADKIVSYLKTKGRV